MLSHHCFEGHTLSKQDFLLGVEQSHISAIPKKQAQRQHLSASLSFAQHPQHSSDIHAGQIFIPCDFKHCLIMRKRKTSAKYAPITIMTIAAVDSAESLFVVRAGVGRIVGAMIDLLSTCSFSLPFKK